MKHEVENAQAAAPPRSDALAATLAELRRLVGVLAAITGETPRSILEDEFKQAPSDAFWRAKGLSEA